MMYLNSVGAWFLYTPVTIKTAALNPIMDTEYYNSW